MRTCIKCGVTKRDEEFKKHYDAGVVRYRNVCLSCWNAHRRKAVEADIEDVLAHFLDAVDYKEENIDTLPEEKFRRCFHVEDDATPYDILKELAHRRLQVLGYSNPRSITLEAHDFNRFLLIGDTFGKKTSTAKFQLLKRVADYMDAKAIIHIGHATDDYNDVSNLFSIFNRPVYFLPIKDELRDVQHICANPDFHIALDEIHINDLLIKNQDFIAPYIKTAISVLDPLHYPGKCITNCTRHEYFTRTSTFEPSFIASPGAMAEPHVVRTRYKTTLAQGKRINVKMNKDVFAKYRKDEVAKELWECGFIAITAKDNSVCIQPCRIDTDNMATVVDSKYITLNDTVKVTPNFAVLSDIHAPNDDGRAMANVLNMLVMMHPAQIIINGDLMDCRAANPHDPFGAMNADFDKELAHASVVLEALEAVTGHKPSLIMGNHEDFLNRYLDKCPQFKNFVLKHAKEELEKHCTISAGDKNDVVRITPDVCIMHGSAKLFGVNGSNLDKISRAVSRHTIMGHTHSPAIRLGVYCSGCLCKLKQGYNNAVTSNWAHGFLLVYNINNFSFVKQVFL